MRTRSSGRPRAARTSAGIDAWLMKQGMLLGGRGEEVGFVVSRGTVGLGCVGGVGRGAAAVRLARRAGLQGRGAGWVEPTGVGDHPEQT